MTISNDITALCIDPACFMQTSANIYREVSSATVIIAVKHLAICAFLVLIGYFVITGITISCKKQIPMKKELRPSDPIKFHSEIIIANIFMVMT